MKQRLLAALRETGMKFCLDRFADGSEVLVLPHGGRVLGLFAPGGEENFLWTNPALETAAAAFFAGDQWHNSGGDRTWLAPEIDFFFPYYPKTEIYFQPRGLDPGRWGFLPVAEERILTNLLRLRLSRSDIKVEMEIRKAVTPAANPLLGEPLGTDGAAVDYAGYTLRTTLEATRASAAEGYRVGLWNLLQMPHGGELLAPTYCRTAPRTFFGNVPPEDLVCDDRGVRYAMRAAGEQKIGLRAIAVTGRVGYRYPAADGRWALVVRNVAIDPSGPYVDAPWNDPNDLGYAIEACNVNSGLGRFSELEHHAPAVGPGTGRLRSEDVVQTWAYRGAREAIDAIAAALLGMEGRAPAA